jgi:modulator of FtsH protease
MSQYNPNMSAMDRLTATTVLSGEQAAVIKQTYILFGIAVISAIAGGYVGATSETLARFFSNWIGWVIAMIALNVVPMIAMAARRNPLLGTGALVFDGFLSGIVLSPILWLASTINPVLIVAALGITGIVFVGITGFIFVSGRTYSAPRGLMIGIFVSVVGAMLLNGFLHMGPLGILISAGIGVLGVIALISSTSAVLGSPDADSPIPGALALFAGVFNIFVATLSILLRLFGGRGRD